MNSLCRAAVGLCRLTSSCPLRLLKRKQCSEACCRVCRRVPRWPVLLAGAVLSLVLMAGTVWGICIRMQSPHYVLIGWNDLGMHCMDDSYAVFCILPPFNNLNAQLVDPNGKLVRDTTGITVTYEAVADPDGSINTTSVGKTDFWAYANSLFGAALPADKGLAGNSMPGAANTPQPMTFDVAKAQYVAAGIPLTPYDDTRTKKTCPMMRLVAKDALGNVLASTSVVLPVSDEVSCTACHATNSNAAAKPAAGWVNAGVPSQDYRLNVLRIHDDRNNASQMYKDALANFGYNAAGLYATVITDGKPILCANCHLSNALGTPGFGTICTLTNALHGHHAAVIDPTTNASMDASTNRSACYNCHPGSTTRCLRGPMGNAVNPDGSLAIQCQDCHGNMSAVADTNRQGWLDEPSCQNCHTGTAMANNGQLRFTSAFDPATGQRRVAVDATFATNPNTPSAGLSLYKLSVGHGSLRCEACHGPTHAEYPSRERNDNIQSVMLQGHTGTLSDCTACHPDAPMTITGGPHGMHPVGQAWVNWHGGMILETGGDEIPAMGLKPAAVKAQPRHVDQTLAAGCKGCHGADNRGTVLSRALSDQSFETTKFGTRAFAKGDTVSCYSCHNGPNNHGDGAPGVVGFDLTGTWQSAAMKNSGAAGRSRTSAKGKFTIVNQGNADSKDFKVTFYLSADSVLDPADIVLKSYSYKKGLKAGAAKSRAVGVSLAAEKAAGGKFLIANIEAGGGADENDTTNNTKYIGPLR